MIELMVAVMVVGVLMAVGMPAMSSMIVGTRLSGEANALIGALNVARSEAQKRGTSVSVCASTGTTCVTNFSLGWRVLSGTTPLLVRPALANGDTITNSAATFPTFNGAGYTFYTGTLTVRDKDNTPELTRCIVFSAGSWVSKRGTECT